MQIVDAQIHLWATGLPSNKAHIQETSFTAKQAITLMDEAGVHAAIIHPPSWDPKSSKNHPTVFITASGNDVYGDHGDEVVTELSLIHI